MLTPYDLRQSVERARSLVVFTGTAGKAALISAEHEMYRQNWTAVAALLDLFWGEYVNYPHRLGKATYQLRKAREKGAVRIGDIEISYVRGECQADAGYCFYNTVTGAYRSAATKTAKELVIQLQQA